MTRRTTLSLIIVSVTLLFVFGGLYFSCSFLGAFAPPKVTITQKYITNDEGFINGVTIEKINVDSIGNENYPVKYTVTYMTSCHMEYPGDRPPNPPNRIRFDKEGKYWWSQEYVSIHFIHRNLGRETTDTVSRPQISMGTQKFTTCPLKFEKEQWYFFNILHPQTTGIFYFIDKNGKNHQYYIESGVSPI